MPGGVRRARFTHSLHVPPPCQGIWQLDVGSRPQCESWGCKLCREEREGGQRLSRMLRRGDPPPALSPKNWFCVQGDIVHPFTASVRWLGWVAPSGSPECGHAWQTVSRQGGLEGGAVGRGQALSKK